MKVNVTISVGLRKGWMRKLNPHLKSRGLTLQDAIEKGMKERVLTMLFNVTAFHAALEGVGLSMDKE